MFNKNKEQLTQILTKETKLNLDFDARPSNMGFEHCIKLASNLSSAISTIKKGSLKEIYISANIRPCPNLPITKFVRAIMDFLAKLLVADQQLIILDLNGIKIPAAYVDEIRYIYKNLYLSLMQNTTLLTLRFPFIVYNPACAFHPSHHEFMNDYSAKIQVILEKNKKLAVTKDRNQGLLNLVTNILYQLKNALDQSKAVCGRRASELRLPGSPLAAHEWKPAFYELLQSLNSKIESSISDMNILIKELQQTASQENNLTQELRKRLVQIESEYNELQKTFDVSQQESNQVINKISDEIAKKEQQLNDLKTQLADRDQHIELSQKQISQFREHIRQLEDEKNNLFQQLGEIQTAFSALKKQVVQLEEEKKTLEMRLQDTRNVLGMHKEEIKNHEDLIKNLRQQLASIQTTGTELQRKLHSTLSALDEANKGRLDKDNELARLEMKCDKHREEISKLAKEKERLELDLETARNNAIYLQKQIQGQTEKVSQIEREQANLQNQIKELKKKEQQLQESREIIERQSKNYGGQAQTLQHQLEQKNKEAQKLKTEVVKLQQEILGLQDELKQISVTDKDKIQEFAAAKKELTEQLTEAKEALKGSEGQVLESAKSLATKEEELVAKVQKEQTLLAQIKELNKKLKKAKEKRAQLVEEYKKSKFESENKISTTDFARELLEKLTEQEGQLKTKYKQKLKKERKKVEDATQELSGMQKELARARKQHDQQANQEATTQELTKLQQETAKLEASLQAAQKHNNYLQELLDRMCQESISQMQKKAAQDITLTIQSTIQTPVPVEDCESQVTETTNYKRYRKKTKAEVENMREMLDQELITIQQQRDRLREDYELLTQKLQAIGHAKPSEREIEELKQQQTEIKTYQNILQQEQGTKENKREMLAKFAENQNLITYYRTILIKLEEIFISCKAAQGGFVTIAEGKVAKAGQAVALLGTLIPIPVGGELVGKIVEIITGKIDEKRQLNVVQHISELATLSELKKAIEFVARKLTEWYEPQLLQLATLEEIDEQRAAAPKMGRFKLLLLKIYDKSQRKILKRETYPPTKQIAEFAVLWLLDALQKGITWRPDLDLGQELMQIVLTHQGATGFARAKMQAAQAFGLGEVFTRTDQPWSVEEIYTMSGIEDECGKLWVTPKSDVYGYCHGTSKVAEARRLSAADEIFNHQLRESIVKCTDPNELAKFLSQMEYVNLHKLELKGNVVVMLAKALQGNQRIKSLNLSHTKLSVDNLQILIGSIQTIQTLETLNLSSNHFGNKGATFIAELLRTNQNLKALLLYNTAIKDKGADIIINNVPLASQLIKIDLEETKVSKKKKQSIYSLMNQRHHLVVNRRASELKQPIQPDVPKSKEEEEALDQATDTRESAFQDEFHTQKEDVQPTSVKLERLIPPPKPAYIQTGSQSFPHQPHTICTEIQRQESEQQQTTYTHNTPQGFFQPVGVSSTDTEVLTFEQAIQKDDVATITLLIDRGFNPMIKFSNGDTELHKAVRANSQQVLKYLVNEYIQRGSKSHLEDKNDERKTALDIAKEQGKSGMINFLTAALQTSQQQFPHLY